MAVSTSPRPLGKVASYLKNVGKSVAFASLDRVKGSSETISDFIDTNEDLFKDTFSAVRNYRQTIKTAGEKITSSKYYSTAMDAKKAVFQDLKSGTFYNKKREDEFNIKAMGEDFADMLGSDWDESQFDFGSDDDDSSSGDSLSASNMDNIMGDAVNSTCSTMVQTASMIADSNTAGASAIIASNNQAINAVMRSVSSGLGIIHGDLTTINKVLMGPMQTHMNNSKTYYESTTKLFQEQTAMMKEILDMQRNLYSNQRSQNNNKSSAYSNVAGAGGLPDLRSYGKEIVKNLKNLAGPEFDMLFGDTFGKGSNMLYSLIGSPLKFIPDLIAKTLVPAVITKAVKGFDETLSSVFSNLVAQFNKSANEYADDDAGFKGVIKQYIGKIFGLEIDSKDRIDTSKYQKGTVPFDGITRKSIVEVIPGYLRRIEAAITGDRERVFDLDSGKWKSASQIEREYKNMKSNAVASGSYEVMNDLKEFIKEMKVQNHDEYKENIKALENMFSKIYEDSGAFRPGSKNFAEDNAFDYGFTDEKVFQAVINKMLKGSGIKGLAGNMISAKENVSRQLRQAEDQGYSIYNNLFNDSMEGVSHKGQYNEKSSKAMLTGKHAFNVIKDSKGHNLFYYMQNILGELMLLRKEGGGGGGRKGKKRPNGPIGVNTASDMIPTDRSIYEDEERDERESNAERERYLKEINEDSNLNEGNYESYEDRLEAYAAQKMKGEKGSSKIRAALKMNDGDKLFDKLLQAQTLSEKMQVITGGVDTLMKKPAAMLASVITKADQRVFDLLFGDNKIKDEDGQEAKGFMDYMVIKLKGTFEKVNTWIDDSLDKLKSKLGIESFGDLFKKIADKTGLTDKWDKYGKPIVGMTKDKLKRSFGWGKSALTDVYGGIRNAAQRGVDEAKLQSYLRRVSKESDEERQARLISEVPVGQESMVQEMLERMNTESNADRYTRHTGDVRPDVIQGALARGKKYVPRTGLYTLSKGEMVVPSELNPYYKGKTNKTKQISNESKVKRRFKGVLGSFAKGTGGIGTNIGDGKEYLNSLLGKGKDAVSKGTIGEIIKTAGADITDTASSGLTGGILGIGATLLTGLAGGPIIGAAIGVAHSLVSRSEVLQNALFGKMGEDGNREEGGMISPKIQKAVKKYMPDMGKGGLAGAVAGLVTPFGPVGGMIIGSAIGFAKNNEAFNDYLFGKAGEDGERSGGLVSADFASRVSKALPRMGLGAAAGMLLGPGGFLLNAALGAGAGMFTTTDKFKNLMLGEEDEEGNRKGGIIGAVHDGFVVPLKNRAIEFGNELLDFGRTNIFEPLKNFMEPVTQSMKNLAGDIANHMKDSLDMVFTNAIGMPLGDMVREKFVKPITKFLGKTFNVLLKPAKFLVSAPFKALGAIGNNLRAGQIKKGKANNMTAQERLDWRGSHSKKFRSGDQYNGMDNMLAGLDQDTLQNVKNSAGQYLQGSDYLKNQRSSKAKSVGEAISNYFKDNKRDEKTTLYDFWGYRNVKKVIEAVSTGDTTKAEKLLKARGMGGPLTKDEQNKVRDIIGDHAEEIADLAELEKEGIKGKQELMGDLYKLTGKKFEGRKDIRHLFGNLDTEIKDRKDMTEEEKEEADKKGMNPDIAAEAEMIYSRIDTTNALLRRLAGIPKSGDDDILGSSADKASETDVEKARTGAGITPNDEVNMTDINETLDLLSSRLIDPLSGEIGMQDVNDDKGFANSTHIGDGISTHTTPGGHVITYLNGKAQDDKSSQLGMDELNDNAEREIKNAENIEETSEHTGGLFSKLFGSKKGPDKRGLFDKIGDKLGGIGKTLGKVALFVGGIALSGHLSEYWKTTLWPEIRDKVLPKLGAIIIGDKDPESGTLHGGLRGLLFGNKDTEGNYEGGLFPGIGKVLEPIASGIGKLVNFVVEPGEGGLRHWFTNEAIPGAAKWIVQGFGFFNENLLAPMVAGLIKALPTIGKGIVMGVKELFGIHFGNKEYSRSTGKDAEVDVGPFVNEVSSRGLSTNEAKTRFAGIINTTGDSSGSGNTKIDYAKGLSGDGSKSEDHTVYNEDGSINYAATLQKEMAAEANKANAPKNGEKKNMWGSYVRQNNVQYDENGNITTVYSADNKDRTLGERTAGAAARGFLNGLSGMSGGGLLKAMGNISLHPSRLLTGGIGGMVGETVKTGAKLVGGVPGTANKAGAATANWLQKAANGAGVVTESAANFGNADYTALYDQLAAGADDIAAGAAKVAGNSADDVIAGAASAAGKQGIVSKVVTKAGAAISGAASKVAAKAASTTVGSAITTALTKLANTSFVKNVAGLLGKAVTPGAVKQALITLAEKLGAQGTKGLASSALKGLAGAIGNASPLALITTIADVGTGFADAYVIFGVPDGGVNPDGTFTDTPLYKLNILQRLLAGLIRFVSNKITWGFIPAEVIVDIAIDYVFPVFGINIGKLKAARDPANVTAVIDAWNKQHTEEQYDNLKDFNLRNNILHKGWKAIKETASNVTTAVGNWWLGEEGEDGTRTGGAWNAVKDTAVNAGNAVATFFAGEKDAETGARSGGVIDKAAGFFSNVGTNIQAGMNDLNNGLGAAFGMVDKEGKPISLSQGVSNAWSGFTGAIGQVAGNLKDTVLEFWNSSDKDIGTRFKNLTKGIGEAADNLNKNIGAMFGMVDDKGNPLSLTDGLKKDWDKFRKGFTDGAKNLFDKGKDLWGNFTDGVGNFFGFGNGRSTKSNVGYGRGYGSGHMYQKDPRIANMPFVKGQTIGEAGCGPVAASNLVNSLDNYGYGSLDIKSAANHAKRGFTGPDGGTSLGYFNSVLNQYGYPNKQSSSSSEVYNNLKQGNQAVLLGKDKLGPEGPYSDRMHFINAKGLDNRGNIIVEDPDRPESSRTYRAKDVLGNMHGSVIASPRGRGRKSISHTSFRKSYAAPRKYGYGPAAHSELAKKAYNVISQLESSTAGKYGAIAMDDNGAMSVGRIQWNASRAKTVLMRVCEALGEKRAVGIIGQSLYNDIMGGSSWKKRTASGSEKTSLSKLLDTNEGHIAQDEQALDDIEDYISNSVTGMGMKNEAAMIYLTDMINVGPPSAYTARDAAKSICGSYAKIDLDTMHSCAMKTNAQGSGSRYASRRNMCYQLCKDPGSISSDLKLGSQMASSSSTSTGSLLDGLKNLGVSIVKKLFGENAFNAIFGSSDSAQVDSSVSANSLPTEVQQALVDKMKSINGKINYTLGDTQDPDKGAASCASTVGWAYRKVLGDTDPTLKNTWMSSSSSTQSNDSRFSTVYTSGIKADGSGKGSYDETKMQPGDVVYYRRSSRSDKPYKMGHTEMYIGDGKVSGHGGPEWNDKGTRERNLTGKMQGEDVIMVRRYNGLLDGVNMPASTKLSGNVNAPSGSLYANAPKLIKDWPNAALDNTPDDTASSRSFSGSRTSGTFGGSRGDSFGKSRSDTSLARGRHYEFNKYGISNATASRASGSRVNYVKAAKQAQSYGHARQNYGYANANVSVSNDVAYIEFLKTIVDILMTIANNSEALTKILNILSTKFGINVAAEDVSKANASSTAAKQKISNLLSQSANSPSGYGSMFTDKGTEYILKSMQQLARE